jgi:hypothetical protein
MSANNWARCPRCVDSDLKKQRNEIAEINAMYGRITADEFVLRIEDARQEVEHQETLREGWEIGTDDDGTFSVSYSCRCDKCGFRFSFKHEHDALQSDAKSA